MKKQFDGAFADLVARHTRYWVPPAVLEDGGRLVRVEAIDNDGNRRVVQTDSKGLKLDFVPKKDITGGLIAIYR